MLLNMANEFCSVPKIDFDSYDPKTKRHNNSTFTAKSTFERTALFDRTVTKGIIDEKTYHNDSESFIRDNMNKWPVIFVNMHSLKLGSPSPSLSKIQEKLSTTVIQETFEKHEDVLFALMVEEACTLEYKRLNRESYLKLLKYLDIADNKGLSSKIRILWGNYGKEMDEDVQKFYRFYKGMPPYDSVADSLKFLSKILHDFYKQKVIVLVDEHDVPALHMYSEISLDKPENNTKIIDSIHFYAKTITDLLDNVCKYNQNRERFLMCGVTNSVIDAPYSGFNNLKVYDALNPQYAEFFSLSKREVNETVNFLFKDIMPELRKNITSNIDRWYNGYYGSNSSPMYSIFSTGQYLNDCFGKFVDLKIQPNETSDKWIPEPKQYWATSSVTSILNSYMSIGFEGQFHYFLKNLIDGVPAKFVEPNPGYVPLFEDPSDPDQRGEILINLLLHGGFLARYDKDDEKFVKIPNLELTDLFHFQLDKLLKRFPISKYRISCISKALLDQNFTAFGIETMGGLYDCCVKDTSTPDSDKYRTKGKGKDESIVPEYFPKELHIHRMLSKVFFTMKKERIYEVRVENGEKGNPIDEENKNGFYRDFIFSPKWAKGDTHFILELKTEKTDREGYLKNSLRGLRQIFDENYHRDLLGYEKTKAIVNIGITASNRTLSMATFKVYIDEESYKSADKVKFQEFNATKDANNTIVIAHSKIKEAEIDMFFCLQQDAGKGSNMTNAGIATNCTEVANVANSTNTKIQKTIGYQLGYLIANPSKFNETDAQTNSAAGSTT
jgi:hypothetical protein